jgi:hypothetical protein
MIGSQHDADRARDLADKVAERASDAQPLQLLVAERVPNQFVHVVSLDWRPVRPDQLYGARSKLRLVAATADITGPK